MKRVLLLIAMVSVALMASGCKVRITVPEGGEVVTESGSFTCSEGQTCEIDVVDLFFDENFLAVPKDGWEFLQWAKFNRSFCGGNNDACRLFTSNFEGQAILLGFLNKPGEVFNLRPEFVESGAVLGGGSAHACFNSVLGAVGTTEISEYRSTDAAGISATYNNERQITGGHSFNGKASRRSRSEVVVSAPAASTLTTDVFFKQDASTTRVYVYGNETTIHTPSQVTSVLTLDPHILSRFNLNPGQTYSSSWTQTIETQVAGTSHETVQSGTREVVYLGRETVDVPAGSFETCKFSQKETLVDGGGTFVSNSNTWFGLNNGVLIRQTAEGSETVLLSAEINGSAI